MKNAIIVVLFLALAGPCRAYLPQDSCAQYVDEIPFQRGESGKYRVYYDSWITSGISAGVGLISIKEDIQQFQWAETLFILK